MTTVEVWLDDDSLGPAILVGRLGKNASRSGDTVRFDYDQAWLASNGVAAFALDYELPLVGGAHYAPAGADQLSAAFLDCSPDRWGKMLMERREAIVARQQGRKVQMLRAWDFLLGVNDESRMGALRLKDPQSGRFLDFHGLSAPPLTDLRVLEDAAGRIDLGDDADIASWIMQLVAPGASLGGARPKASFRDADGSLWLAKFPSREDRRDVGLWELLAHQLSAAAGIDVPPARVLRLSDRGHTFAVRRFDRTPTSRRHYSSAMTRLARVDSDGASYLDVVQAIETGGASTRIDAQLEQLFRRALFNVLIGNRDDHLRNHGFLREGNGWVLSPAFDVNPNPDKGEHVLTLDGADGSPDSALLVATHGFYRLGAGRAAEVEVEVRNAVRPWADVARKLGLRSAEVERMRDVIDAER